MIYLFTDRDNIQGDAEISKLLHSVGDHLGTAIAKSRLDKESRNLVLMRERGSLAFELHDSLAQSIAALRFKVSNLQHSLGQDDMCGARVESRRIQDNLDQVNTELRDLIASFRAPVDERGLLPALEEITMGFRKEAGIPAYFQSECSSLRLPAAAEAQVLGIVREALTNVKKHSHANMVRVLLQDTTDSGYRLLIEDDGCGIVKPPVDHHPAAHIGLSIMQDRAKRLGGELKIDSDRGEGTRIELVFYGDLSYPADAARLNVS